MADILVSWIGTKDIEGADQNLTTGPLVSILRFHRFDYVYLCDTIDDTKYTELETHISELPTEADAFNEDEHVSNL